MPPRLITGAILAFWLVMTAWLMEREVVPVMLADASPSYLPDLTDEIGSPLVGWTVYRNGTRIGSATSKVEAMPDRTFEFRSTFHFDRLTFGQIHLRQMENVYHVTENGRLLGLSTMVSVNFGPKDNQIIIVPDAVLGFEGELVDNVLEPRLSIQGEVQKLDKIDMHEHGSIVNSMHLVNRLRGLHNGQTWKITIFDPIRMLTDKLVGNVAKGMTIPAVIAKVTVDILPYDRQDALCYVIEYSEPGKEPSARTWVRKIDGLVLQQEASHGGFDMVLKRIPH